VARSARTPLTLAAAIGVPTTAAIIVWAATQRVVFIIIGALYAAFVGLWRMVAGPAYSMFQDRVDIWLTDTFAWRFTGYGNLYRKYLVNDLRFIDTAKLGSAVESGNLELEDVFVDIELPRVRALGHLEAGVVPTPGTSARAGFGAPSQGGGATSRRLSIWDHVDREPPAVIAVLGAPGSGKTTLLKHVALGIARDPGRRRRTIPALVTIREHADRITSDSTTTLAQILRATAPPIRAKEPQNANWWEAQLDHGSCVILLDGLDEVSNSEQRKRVAEWIRGQISANAANDFVVTSRPGGYREAQITNVQVELWARPFTDEQVKRFLRGWYRAVETREAADEGPEALERAQRAASEKAADLIDRLAAAPALYDLTVNPMLLTMLANVHRFREALPGSRVELYHTMCEVALRRPTGTGRLDTPLEVGKQIEILSHLAYTMMERGVRSLDGGKVLEIVRPDIRRLPVMVSAEDFLAGVSENGLLVEREKPGHYEFAHLTFQEYLAAMHIRQHGMTQILTQNVDNPWWRETTLLYAAAEGAAGAEPIVRACLASGTIAALSMAFDCTEDGTDLDSDLQDTLARTMDSAFERNTSPERRRLVAGVLAARHLRPIVYTQTGGKACRLPVPADLYQLFLMDTDTPLPDGHRPVSGRDSTPVTGIWSGDAAKFLDWVNALFAGSAVGSGSGSGTDAEYRLPSAAELDYLAAPGIPATPGAPALPPLIPSVAGAWAAPETGGSVPMLWTAPQLNPPFPRSITHDQLIDAVAEDVRDTQLLAHLVLISGYARVSTLLAALLGKPYSPAALTTLATRIVRDLDRARALNRRQESALDLVLADAPDTESILEQGLRRTRALDRALGPELDRARSIERALSRPNADFRAVGSSARDIARGLTRMHDLCLAHGLGFALGLHDSLTRIDHHVQESTDAISEGMVSAALEAALGRELSKAVNTSLLDRIYPTNSDSGRQFAIALTVASGIPTILLPEFAFDEITAAVRKDCGFIISYWPSTSWPAVVADHLKQTVEFTFEHREPLSPANAAGLRLAALALAGEPSPRNRSGAFDNVALGVTLLEERRKDPTRLESLILARV
jgi:hypothetical protein